VRAAILAASPHNTQPWLFKVTNSAIELYIDTTRNVGALDPYLREEHIGMGCALENLMLAAAANGYQATVTLVPGKLGPIPAEGMPKLVARIELSSGKREENELYDAIPRRHTNRSAYIPQKPIPPEFIDALTRLTSDELGVKMFLLLRRQTEKRSWKSVPRRTTKSIPTQRWIGAAIDGFESTGVRSRNFAMALRLMPSECRQSPQLLPRPCLSGC